MKVSTSGSVTNKVQNTSGEMEGDFVWQLVYATP